MQCNLLTSVIKWTFLLSSFFMKIVTFTRQNRRFDFFSILIQSRDFDVVGKNRHSTIRNYSFTHSYSVMSFVRSLHNAHCKLQEAQLSARDRTMLCVRWTLVKYCRTVQQIENDVIQQVRYQFLQLQLKQGNRRHHISPTVRHLLPLYTKTVKQRGTLRNLTTCYSMAPK